MVGVDEVGRGCLAGPLLVVAARKVGKGVKGLTDSKLLSDKERRTLFNKLSASYEFGEGWVKPKEINDLGLAGAMKLGSWRAIKRLKADKVERIIMDGPVNYLPSKYENVSCVIKADVQFPVVSAASIYAKVKRDNYMQTLAKRHTHYGFETNFGYGTPKHLEALNKYGYLKTVHRRFFEPVFRLDQTKLW